MKLRPFRDLGTLDGDLNGGGRVNSADRGVLPAAPTAKPIEVQFELTLTMRHD